MRFGTGGRRRKSFSNCFNLKGMKYNTTYNSARPSAYKVHEGKKSIWYNLKMLKND